MYRSKNMQSILGALKRRKKLSAQEKMDYLEAAQKRFWVMVEKTNNCWNWKGTKTFGYGRFSFFERMVRAHRFSYEIMVGQISRWKNLDHICRNRECVNPSHLRQVYFKDNVLCGNGPTAINARKTKCIRGHELTKDNLYFVKGNPGRRCKKCHFIREKKYKSVYVREGKEQQGEMFQ